MPILLDWYQKNTDWEVGDHKITWRGILKNISSSVKKTVTFDLSPIQRIRKNGLSQISIEKIFTSKVAFTSDRS